MRLISISASTPGNIANSETGKPKVARGIPATPLLVRFKVSHMITWPEKLIWMPAACATNSVPMAKWTKLPLRLNDKLNGARMP